jgi:hypothetical protein
MKKDSLSFYSLLWFMSKYAAEGKLYEFIVRYRNIWQGHSFLRRQATAAMARFSSRIGTRLELINNQAMSGIPTAVSVATQLSQFAEFKDLPFNLNAYIFPTKIANKYTHSKFIVLCSVLASEQIRNDPVVHAKIQLHVLDPWHRNILRSEFSIPLP